VYARAVVNFSDFESGQKFKSEFDGHTFVDNKGREQKCVVEYCLSQQIPQSNPPINRYSGTITEDPDYQKFLSKLTQPIQYLPSAEKQYEERKQKEIEQKPVSTPLLDDLKSKASQQEFKKFKGTKKRGGGQRRNKKKEPGAIKIQSKQELYDDSNNSRSNNAKPQGKYRRKNVDSPN